MGAKIEKAKTILNAVKEVGETVLEAAEKIDESISKANPKEDIIYGVTRVEDDGKTITLCSIHEANGKWCYHKGITVCNEKEHRSTTQYFKTMPTQEELDSVRD